jgi:Flp pilus assembly pilin Flp
MLRRLNTSLAAIARRLVKDEQGGEVIEYALILGLVIVLAIVTITSVGTKVLARWQTVNSSM